MAVTFTDLVELMRRLRAPDGCPWDREQTYATLAPMLLEEAYEAFDAVEAAREGRASELCDELGDLLFQIVFYAQVATERGEFAIDDVVAAIHEKMVRRHPHVFGTESADDTATVLKNWEAIKAEERRAAGKNEDAQSSILDGVSAKAPALMEAHQLATKAARVGFDWTNIGDVFAKLREEIDELEAAIKERDAKQQPTSEDAGNINVRDEVGDILFAVSNVARHLKIEPEAAAKLANRKFRCRFRFIEQALRADGKRFEDVTLDEMETFWQAAKRAERDVRSESG
ncbi:MAG: nucleoside triphosphate pyrophosphohydrolase [Pyrinomonadaceae bacterium MAG19_C2-C3]|nr:nucleoside triphosphate pyrophosphohydrolase [Pyrinomonadaceae bacterium MAG19_C2-C3]